MNFGLGSNRSASFIVSATLSYTSTSIGSSSRSFFFFPPSQFFPFIEILEGQMFFQVVTECLSGEGSGFDHLCGDSAHDGEGRDGFVHDRLGHDHRPRPDRYVAQDGGTVFQNDTVLDLGVSIAQFLAGATQCHPVQNAHVVTNGGGLTDHYGTAQ
jgi:hypothetical protein